MSEGRRKITLGRYSAAVKVHAALLLALICVAIPQRPERPAPVVVDVLAVLVTDVRLSVPTASGREVSHAGLDDRDRGLIRRELHSFSRRVARATHDGLRVRIRQVEVPGPLTRLAGPGPHWLSPEIAGRALDGRVEPRPAETVLVFARVPEGVPVSHLGAAHGGDRGLNGSCFAGILMKDGWLNGTGTVALHEWLHGVRWTLTEVAGFPEAQFPDPDDGRAGPTCCRDAPKGDGPYADHLLTRHLTPTLLRALEPGAGLAVRDGFLRGWTLDGQPRASATRTVLLSPGVRSARARLPAGVGAIEVLTTRPVLVLDESGEPVRVNGSARLRPTGDRLEVRRAVGGAEVAFQVRVLAE